MRLALAEALRAQGRTSPNPIVGAVLVKHGRVVAKGHHRRAGAPHAEAEVLRVAGEKARGADLYTSLEPCDHFGRTPPCTQAILESGVRRVFYASSDPNPLVMGKGVRRLRRAGLEVHGGVLGAEADALNRPFFKYIRTGLPFVTLKVASTLDGKLATASGDSRWVTGAAARERVHRLRDRVDAIVVGAGTVDQDDPQLTTRLPEGGGRDPLRLVVDSGGRTSPAKKLFRLGSSARTVLALSNRAPRAREAAYRDAGAEVWRFPAGARGVRLKPLLRRLATEGCNHVLVEGGAQLFASFLRERLADELWLFLAPKLVGASGLSWVGELEIARMAGAQGVTLVSAEAVGSDLLIVADL